MRVVRVGEGVARHKPSLAEKGSFQRVFRGFGLFTEAALLFSGSYLLTGALLRPLEAEESAVIGGGLMLALATMLLLYLFWPSRRHAPRREDSGAEPHDMLLTAYGNAVRARVEATRALANEDDLPGPM